jgi:hypothetical protein
MHLNLPTAVVTALITACVTILGWFVAQQLTLSRENRNRKLDNLIKHYQRQIEEFYRPLFNDLHQMFVLYDVHHSITDAPRPEGKPYLSEDEAGKVTHFYLQARYAPLHAEVMQIIKAKLYLIDGPDMPQSFYDYLKHAIQERDQWELYNQLGVDTSFLRGVPWPEHFYFEVKSGFERAMRNYEKCIGQLRK